MKDALPLHGGPPSAQAAPRPLSALRALVRALRPHQWVKNLSCFAGLLFSGRLLEPAVVADAGAAFGGFCLMASAIYLFNDYLDRERDRLNPRTARRPLASGALPVWLAALACVGLVAAAGLVAAWLGRNCLVVLATYAAVNLGYSLRFKQTVIADVMCIALGFVLRVLFGVYAVHVNPSPWIILCMFFLALFLAVGKRKSELRDLGEDAAATRAVLEKYSPEYLDMVFGVTATITILSYTLYTVAGHHNPTMVVTVFPVVYCVLRYAQQVYVKRAGQSPEMLFVKDKMLWIGVTAWLVLCLLILYGGLRLVEFPPHS